MSAQMIKGLSIIIMFMIINGHIIIPHMDGAY